MKHFYPQLIDKETEAQEDQSGSGSCSSKWPDQFWPGSLPTTAGPRSLLSGPDLLGATCLPGNSDSANGQRVPEATAEIVLIVQCCTFLPLITW